jgi:protein-tyrosine phosphatase
MNIIFDNILNARDLGGLPAADGRTIKSGLLLRTALLMFATDNDIARLQNEYHLARIFDFRSYEETEFQPDRPIPGAMHHILPTIDMRAEQDTVKAIPEEAFRDLEKYIVNYSFYPEVQRMAANMYPSLIRSEYSQLQYAAFLRLIVETPEGAVLWHCTAGKDRVGVATMLILSALGVSRGAILEDYLLTNGYLAAEVDETVRQAKRYSDDPDLEFAVRAFEAASEKYMRNAWDSIDRNYGSTEAFLAQGLGFGAHETALLREKYLT